MHDVESNSGKGYNKHQAEADLNLLTSLATNTASTDPEDLLYEGVATLAMVFQLATHNQIDAQNIPFVVGAVDQAIQEIQTGVAGLALINPVELAAILAGVFGAPTGTAYELEFTFPNTGGTEIQQEFLEAMVTTAIGDVINEAGELAYVPPPVGTDDYLFRFDVATLDLDLLPIL